MGDAQEGQYLLHLKKEAHEVEGIYEGWGGVFGVGRGLSKMLGVQERNCCVRGKLDRKALLQRYSETGIHHKERGASKGGGEKIEGESYC